MCIVILTTEHPEFPLVLLLNRDEFFKRPTERANFRPGSSTNEVKILLPLDLARPEHGTWMGVSTDGKIAVLVNYSEKGDSPRTNIKLPSRGILPISYLNSGDNSEDEWLAQLQRDITSDGKHDVSLRDIGGFLLLYGKLSLDKKGKLNRLNVLSNRGDRGVIHETGFGDGISYQTTFGLLNSLYYDPWPKVKLAEKLLLEVVSLSVARGDLKEKFVEACFGVLSTNKFNSRVATDTSVSFEKKLQELRKSIFIPPVHTGYGTNKSPVYGEYYGTRTQTVVLLHRLGKLYYEERTLHEDDTENEAHKTAIFEINLEHIN